MSSRRFMTPPTHDSRQAKFARATSPGYGYCMRCGMPWARVGGHVTHYSETRGCFPLCEACWTMLGHPEARIEYYAALIDEWIRLGAEVTPEERTAIGRAVAAEGVTA